MIYLLPINDRAMPSSTLNIAQLSPQRLQYKRLFIPIVLLALMSFSSSNAIIIQSLADAFLQVTVFVAATLFLYYFLIERFPILELSYVRHQYPHFEVLLAAVLGALPGCGGAIIVVTQYTKGQASFGSVVAVLTATMGDAAFLLLATKPLDGMIILSMGLVVGTLSGYLVNLLHPADYLVPTQPETGHQHCATPDSIPNSVGRIFWRGAIIPSLLIGLLLAFQFDFAAISPDIEQYVMYFGAGATLLVVSLWAVSSPGESYQELTSEDAQNIPYSRFNKVMQDTHFVTTWVVVAFILYEVVINVLGVDLKQWFSYHAVYAPLIGMLIGLLPGCGPQILVTSLYIQGIVPFSALSANAISNDGDALFPAIALAPKAALVATFYSAIPALIVGYSIHFFS